jgi:D-hexose-6-phosphate mutarotase
VTGALPVVSAALPPSVRAEAGRGGLPRLVVATASAAAEVYLQGAHLTSWVPAGHEPVIWMSQHSTFAPGSALRGGVPVCFPWFGPHPSDGAPLHGFARISDWTLTHVAEEGDDVRLTLTLTDTDTSRSTVWPYPFAARYLVTLGASLTLALEVENTGAEAITFDEAFHTYLHVGDVRTTSITGLEQSRYVDRLAPPEWHPPDGETLRLTAESDRLYEQPGSITVVDPANGRSLQVVAQGSANAVVWNPWITKAAAMDDFGDDEWTQLVCVETCNVLDRAVILAPGQRHMVAATITASPLS